MAPRTGLDEPVRRDSPITLTAVDGAELPLRVLQVRSVLDQPLAFTELELEFDNPEGRALEGQLALVTPPGARVTRFAALRDGQWHEAEVVPRRAALQQLGLGPSGDAALIGGADGERFVARVEPIAAHGPTRLVIAYVEELRGRREPYRVALGGLPQLRRLDLKLRARGQVALGGDPALQGVPTDGTPIRFTDFRPAGDLAVQTTGPRELGLRKDNMVVARISPVPHDHPDPIESLTVLFDTSASQAIGWDTHVDRLGQLLTEVGARVPEDIPLRVVCFDQSAELAYDGKLRRFGAAELAEVRARRPLGASNLSSALRFAAGVGERPHRRLVVISDGIATAGERGEAALKADAARLRDAGIARVDVVAAGGAGDPALLGAFAAIARDAGARPGLLLRGGVTPRTAAHRMTRSVLRDLEVRVPGSEWVYPAHLDGVQAGDDVLVYADYRGGEDVEIELVGEELATRHDLRLVDTPSPLVADAWAGAHAAWLIDEARGCDRAIVQTCDKWRERALEFSLAHRLVNDTTAMVVLGSSADYPRFGLDGGALRPVLAVGIRDLERRRPAPLPEAAPQSAAAVRPHALVPGLRKAEWIDPPPSENKPAVPVPPVRADRLRRTPPERRRREREPGEAVVLAAEASVPDKDAGLHFGPRRTPEDAYEGNFLTVMNLLADWDDKQNALGVAQRWQRARPSDVMALVALGEALEANGRPEVAARAYGSLIDLYPGRADLRRLAAERLERLGDLGAWLALDSYSRAVEQRYDDPAGYRLYGYALLRAGYYQEAFDALVDGLAWARVDPKTRPLERVLLDDLGLVAAAWIHRWPDQRAYVQKLLRVHEATLATGRSLRFVLSWDNEHSDVDLHVRDGNGWHAFYRHKALDSGGRLLDDMDAGYGLEVFLIEGEPAAYPYRIEVGYYGRGAGHGMGKVQIVEHDGEGRLHVEDRPFVVLKQRGYVDLGALAGPLAPSAE